MRKRLSDSDRKFIVYQMRPVNALTLMIIAAGGFYNLFYFSIPEFQISKLFLLLIDMGILLFAWLVFYFGTRQYYRDLQEDNKIIKTAKVQKKESYVSYEAGSGSQHIPILGKLFPKLFSIKMKSTDRYYLIVNNTRMRVDAETYNRLKEGDDFEMHYTAVSGLRISGFLFV